MKTLVALLVMLSGALFAALADNFRVRFQLKQIKLRDAEIVSNALGSGVLVDGIELPKPEDTRWSVGKYEDKQARLKIGSVVVDEKGYVYIGLEVRSMSNTPATKKYCAAVWKEYRSRVARKAIDETTST